ncbi:MAG TPA: hypothetical protein VK324_01555 [Tepidisphaeraceae bacterium]|nr:hypothetical protein [Tepidisphaeraceae bacterium]
MSTVSNDSLTPPATPPAKSRRGRWFVILLAIAVVIGIGAFLLRGSGAVTKVVRLWDPTYKVPREWADLYTRPVEGQRDAVLTGPLTIAVSPAKGGTFDPATATAKTVRLIRKPDDSDVTARISMRGRSVIVIDPAQPLEPATTYTMSVNGLWTKEGARIIPRELSFTTGTPAPPDIRFAKIALPAARDAGFTGVEFGPDGKLYANTDDGRIFRFAVQPDGQPGPPQVIETVFNHNGGKRIISGIAFEPGTDPASPRVWVVHTFFGFDNCPDFSGKLSLLSGPNLEQYEDVLVNLPRSVRDHISFQPKFGPDGALYFHQGSNTSWGDPDPGWGDRPQHLLTASVLRVDLKKLPAALPLDVKTVDAGGPYDPRSAGAPVTTYAQGIRVAYDLCWHSNGHLYAAVNGSSLGGNIPKDLNGPVPAVKNVAVDENDWLFRVQPGGYHGHPNPAQGHYVHNGGNPTAGIDLAETSVYPVGTQPAANWVPPIYDMGPHISANGQVEYLGDAFGGKLKHALLVCRYNVGSDLIAFKFDAKGGVAAAYTGIPGAANLLNPLDVTEHRPTGNLYVAEYGGRRVTLLRPLKPGEEPPATTEPATPEKAVLPDRPPD